MNLTPIVAASTALLLVAPGARADDPAPPADDATAAEAPASVQAPATPPISPTAPEYGFEFRLGGGRGEGAVLGAALLARTGFIRFSVAAEVLHFVPGERFPPSLEPGDPSIVERGGSSLSVAAGWTGASRPRGGTDRIPGGFAGIPAVRAELLGELGATRIWVSETLPPDDPRGEVWQVRWFPFVGARAGASLRTTGGHLFFGAAVFGRVSITGTSCLATSHGCEDVGGWTAGLVLYGGAEGRLR